MKKGGGNHPSTRSQRYRYLGYADSAVVNETHQRRVVERGRLNEAGWGQPPFPALSQRYRYLGYADSAVVKLGYDQAAFRDDFSQHIIL
jgi:hypothetical protein